MFHVKHRDGMAQRLRLEACLYHALNYQTSGPIR